MEPGGRFQLVETMRWEPKDGFLRLDRHLARLYRSAAALGFTADPQRIGEAIARVYGDGPMRVRMTLAHDGTADIGAEPFRPFGDGTVWTLRVATAQLDAGDQLLRHKTTRRQVYDVARAEFTRDEADEVILLNQRGEVCEGTITNVFADLGDSALVTPPVTSGLLPGVLRGALIDIGRAREGVLTPDILRTAKGLYVGNSLRSLIPARLVV